MNPENGGVQKEGWKVDEVADTLNQPKNPVKQIMEKLCLYDRIRKHYVLKRIF